MASQQFCLKWNNHTNNMLNIFENLLTTETFVDVTLACDGLSLKAHKMVLSACSPFFQSLFLENPCKHPVIIMKDMNYKDLKAIVDFMYHGEVNVSQDQLSALLKTAETLKVKGLAEVSGENRQSSGLVQQEVAAPQQNSVPIPTSTSTPQQQPVMQQRRAESPPLHGKRKRGRPRKRSLSDSNRSDDEMVPTKIKEPDSPEIEELSGDASMDGGNDSMLRQGSNSSQGPIHSSVNSFSRRSHNNAQAEEPPSGEENEFEVEPSKLLEQTLTTDNVPSMSNAASSSTISSANFNLPSSSGMEISQVGVSDNTALVPVSGTSDSLSSSHLQGPDSPQDIKPAILTFEDSPISPAPGTSQSMVYMDQSSMPGTSFQDNSLVQHDAQPQELDEVKDSFSELAREQLTFLLHEHFFERRSFMLSKIPPRVAVVKRRFPYLFQLNRIFEEFDLICQRDDMYQIFKSNVKDLGPRLIRLVSSPTKDRIINCLQKYKSQNGNLMLSSASLLLLSDFMDEDRRAILILRNEYQLKGLANFPIIKCFGTLEQCVLGRAILKVFFEGILICQSENIMEAFFALYAAYYIFNVEFPERCYKTFNLIERLYTDYHPNPEKLQFKYEEKIVSLANCKARKRSIF